MSRLIPIKPEAYITVGIKDNRVVSVEWESVVKLLGGKDGKPLAVKCLKEASKFIQPKRRKQ